MSRKTDALNLPYKQNTINGFSEVSPKMYLRHFIKLLCFFIFYKALQFVIISQTNAQFDTSSQIILASQEILHDRQIFVQFFQKTFHIPANVTNTVVSKILDRLVIWDAVYFSKFFVKGVTYEHEWVFGPLWWRLIRYFPIDKITPTVDVPIPSDNFYTRLLLAVALSNTAHFLTVLVLYELTNATFAESSLAKKLANNDLALKASLLYVLNPAGAFLTAPYSESLANLLTFAAFYLREISLVHHTDAPSSQSTSTVTAFKSAFHVVPYLISGVLISLGIMTRSNIILAAYVYLYDLVHFTFRARRPIAALAALLAGLATFAGFLFLNYLPYREFCPERTAWCATEVPFLYFFAQRHYWNNGLFRYWTANNAPNFLLAVPITALLLLAATYFRTRYYVPQVRAAVHVTYLFVLLGVTSWHVQILTRIAGFIPLPYWYVADKVVEGNNRQTLTGKVFKKKQSRWPSAERIFVGWFFLYGVVQTALFAGFLPPA